MSSKPTNRSWSIALEAKHRVRPARRMPRRRQMATTDPQCSAPRRFIEPYVFQEVSISTVFRESSVGSPADHTVPSPVLLRSGSQLGSAIGAAIGTVDFLTLTL